MLNLIKSYPYRIIIIDWLLVPFSPCLGPSPPGIAPKVTYTVALRATDSSSWSLLSKAIRSCRKSCVMTTWSSPFPSYLRCLEHSPIYCIQLCFCCIPISADLSENTCQLIGREALINASNLWFMNTPQTVALSKRASCSLLSLPLSQ